MYLVNVIGKRRTAIGALGLTVLILPLVFYGLIFPEIFPNRPVSTFISGIPDVDISGIPTSLERGGTQSVPNLDIVICFDVSGSMNDPIPGGSPYGPYKMDSAQYAMETLVNISVDGDRIGIVKYAFQIDPGDTRWWFSNNAVNVTSGLLYQNDTTLITEIKGLSAGGWTDIYAGLNESLEMILEADIHNNTNRIMILLTDGAHNHGSYGIYGNTSTTWNSSRDPIGNPIPASWTVDDYNGGAGPGGAHNYTGFLTYEKPLYNVLSPVLYANQSDIPIYTIGFDDASAGAVEYDPDFLGNISHTTGGVFFEANNTFSLVNTLLKIRDLAAGWIHIQETDDMSLISQGDFVHATWFNVTDTTSKMKVVLNWNDTSDYLRLILRKPNGIVIVPGINATSNVVFNITGAPSFVIIDSPMLGNWTFDVAGETVTGDLRYYVMVMELVGVRSSELPTIDNPSDITYEMGSTGNSITWHPSDNNPHMYNITRNGALVDSDFWAGGDITINVDGLPAGTYIFICTVNDTDGNSVSDAVNVMVVLDAISPSIDHPLNITYEEGITGYFITWNPSDAHPFSYNITRNGYILIDEPWNGSSLTVSVDGLTVGTYIYICTVYDISGNSASNAVFVTVTSPEATPPRIDHPEDIEYEEGVTGILITWFPQDANPSSYIVTRNVIVVAEGSWDGGQITLNVGGLSPGNYTFTCTVYDTADNSASDSVIVVVRYSSGGGGGDSDDIFNYFIFIILILVLGLVAGFLLLRSKKARAILFCPFCGAGIKENATFCWNCLEEFQKCVVCNLLILDLDALTKTPCCKTYAHRAHLKEWLKIKGTCPNCGEKLKEWEVS